MDITAKVVLLSGGGAATWGDITGNMAAQTDLQIALNDKQDVLSFDSTPTENSNNPVTSHGIYTAIQEGDTWGHITGNIASQTDLKTAIDSKQDLLTFDNTPTENSTNPVTSGGVYTAVSGKQDTLTFDNTPTENSNNPVTSHGIYTAVSGKQDTLTFDSTPTLGSTNPVTSHGIYTAIQAGGGGGSGMVQTVLWSDMTESTLLSSTLSLSDAMRNYKIIGIEWKPNENEFWNWSFFSPNLDTSVTYERAVNDTVVVFPTVSSARIYTVGFAAYYTNDTIETNLSSYMESWTTHIATGATWGKFRRVIGWK